MASYVVMKGDMFLTVAKRWSDEFPDAELFDYKDAVYLANKYDAEPVDIYGDE
jgi:hypothetical protein